MAKVIPLNQALKGWFVLVGSIASMFFGGRLGTYLSTDHETSPGVRWLGVAVTAIAYVPWLAIIAWMIATMDEYYRRVAIAGTALAFVVDVVVHIAFNTMVDAGLGPRGLYLAEIPAAGASWIASVAAMMLYYRYRLL